MGFSGCTVTCMMLEGLEGCLLRNLRWQRAISFLHRLESTGLRQNEITYSAAVVSCELATHAAAKMQGAARRFNTASKRIQQIPRIRSKESSLAFRCIQIHIWKKTSIYLYIYIRLYQMPISGLGTFTSIEMLKRIEEVAKPSAVADSSAQNFWGKRMASWESAISSFSSLYGDGPTVK